MSSRKNTTFGLHGDTEARLQREFDEVYRGKLDVPLEMYNTVPNLSTVPEGKPILALDAGNWYIYIKVRGGYKRVQLTAV